MKRMKNQFSDYYFLSCRENSSKIGVNWVQKFTKYDHNSENRILKFDFFFLELANFWSFMEIWTLLKKLEWNFFLF